MRKLLIGLVVGGIAVGAVPAAAQDDGAGEVIVTAMRRLVPDGNDRPRVFEVSMPAAVQTLRRSADFAVQQVVVVGDTSDEGERRAEIYAMTRKAIDLAGAAGVQVASGELSSRR